MHNTEKKYPREDPIEEIERQTNETLAFLMSNINLNNEPGITQHPKKLDNGAVVFDFKNISGDREIVSRKEGNKYKIRIKKLKDGKRYTQRFGGKETYDFIANDKNTFNHQLGTALDNIIGKNRNKIPKTGGKVYELLNSTNNNPGNSNKPSNTPNKGNTQKNNTQNKESNINEKTETSKEKTNIKEKPIDLNYTEKNKEKKVSINFPKNHYSVEGRITRCLRWSSITDAVEDRYGIPRGLLMALMAQEGRGDPTVINQSNGGKCDGGAGLIHMQAVNASKFGLDTIPRTNNGMIDYKHGEKLKKAKSDNNNDLKELSKLDDRFNPVLSVDASARFLLNEYNNLPTNKRGADRWLHAINKYAGRGMQDYGYSVVVYRSTINNIRNKPMPTFTREIEKVKKGEVSAKVNNQRERTDLCINRTKEAINNLNIKIGDQTVSYNEFMEYQKGQCDNYGLDEYSKYDKTHPYKS